MDNRFVVDLGCGIWKAEGAIGIDSDPTVNPDILCDVCNGIPLPDNSVDELITSHFLEHVPSDKAYYVLSEIWRVCKPEATIRITVPHYGHPSAHVPEHSISLSPRAFGVGDKGKGIFLSWFDVIDIDYNYDPEALEVAKRYFPNIPDEDLGKLFLGVIQEIVVICRPKGKGEWTQKDGIREKHWSYYAFGRDLKEDPSAKADLPEGEAEQPQEDTA